MAGNLRELVLSAVTTGTSAEFDATNYKSVECWCEFSAGTSAGVVTLEGAARPGFTGAWVSLGTATQVASTVVRIPAATAGGAGNVAIGAIRARVSTTIVGGTVTVFLLANS